jgi:hypothetical protein
MSKIPATKTSSPKGKDFFGPPYWTTIHCVGATYQPAKAQSFTNFMYSLIDLLPCDECGEHHGFNLEQFPLEKYLRNNHETFFWTYLIHDAVNQQINSAHPDKPKKISPPFEDVKRKYFNALSDGCKNCQML